MKPFDKKAELRREQRPRWWLFGIIVILILAISVVTVVNVGHLEKTIDKRTNAYMKDVSLEVAKNIDYRLAKVTENLTMLEDSLARMDTLAERHEFLERKAPMLGFTYLVEMDARGNVCHADGLETNLSHLSAFQQSMKGEPSVAFLEGQTVLYTIPMWQDGAEKHAGVHRQRQLRGTRGFLYYRSGGPGAHFSHRSPFLPGLGRRLSG